MNDLGKNNNNFKYLAESLQQLLNLSKLSLYIAGNYIGSNENNIKYIAEGL